MIDTGTQFARVPERYQSPAAPVEDPDTQLAEALQELSELQLSGPVLAYAFGWLAHQMTAAEIQELIAKLHERFPEVIA